MQLFHCKNHTLFSWPSVGDYLLSTTLRYFYMPLGIQCHRTAIRVIIRVTMYLPEIYITIFVCEFKHKMYKLVVITRYLPPQSLIYANSIQLISFFNAGFQEICHIEKSKLNWPIIYSNWFGFSIENWISEYNQCG